MKNVAVLGASSNPERYSNKAIKMLLDHGFSVIPVNPYEKQIEALEVVKTVDQITEPVHAVTVYLAPSRSILLKDSLIKLKPKHVIFNPGAESSELFESLAAAGINCENSCTLVLLSTGQFPS